MIKPCIECGKDCEILPIQLGDFFTLTNLRVCSAECMFLIAYEFMRENCIHKSFRNKLNTLENEEDAKERAEYVKMITDESLRMMKEDFEQNPNILSHPVPSLITEMFSSRPEIPVNSGKTRRFTRPCLEDRITWAKEHIQRMKDQLRDALHDLEKLENDQVRDA
jgi:hypothetical protein